MGYIIGYARFVNWLTLVPAGNYMLARGIIDIITVSLFLYVSGYVYFNWFMKRFISSAPIPSSVCNSEDNELTDRIGENEI